MKLALAAAYCSCLLAGTATASEFECRHLAVVDAETGRTLAGIEDLVHHPPSNTLILSVHDRWGDRDGDDNALMGLFSVSLDAPDKARRLAGSPNGSMRPHGIAARPDNEGNWKLLAIDHRYLQEEDRNGEPGTLITEFSIAPTGELTAIRSVGHPDLCPANDLDWLDDDTAIVSLDRTNCGGFWRFLELSRGQWRGRLAAVDLVDGGAPLVLQEDLGFPNGVLVQDRRLIVAFSREERLASYAIRDGRLEQSSSIALQGGGDNLALDSDGRLLLAVHPDLTGFGLYSLRAWGFDSAPTRMVRVGTDISPPDILFEDDEGVPLSGVTGFVEVGGRLYGGAAFDEGLAVCEPK